MHYKNIEEAMIFEDVNNREELIEKVQGRYTEHLSISDQELLEHANRYRAKKISEAIPILIANDPIDW